ncbi:MAG: hypothetical protein JWL72_2943 [Ilumatobacteraceae bacterium]|nr:hypothetical protein [Ilumatobacteraceae bacterium]
MSTPSPRRLPQASVAIPHLLAIAFVCACALAFGAHRTSADASDGNRCLSVHAGPQADPGTPASYFALSAAPGITIDEVLLIANPEEQPCNVSLAATYGQTATNSGDTYPPIAPGTCQRVGCWMTGLPATVTVPASSRVTVPFQVTVPAGTLPGQYLAGVLARPVGTPSIDATAAADQPQVGAAVTTSVGIGVAITVPGALQPSLTIAQVTVDTKADAPLLEIVVRNTGNTWEHPSAGAEIDLGGSAGPVKVEVGANTILPGDSATLTVRVPGSTSGTHATNVTLWYGDHADAAHWTGDLAYPSPAAAAPGQPAESGTSPGVIRTSSVPGWLLPVLVALGLVIVALLVVLALLLRRRRSDRHDRRDGDRQDPPGSAPAWPPPVAAVDHDPGRQLVGAGRLARLARIAVAVILAGAGVVSSALPASAAVALVQKGPRVTGSGTSFTMTLPSGSTAGDLLVATIEDVNGNCGSDTFAGPTGWVRAVSTCRGSVGPVEIWYRPNTPAAVTSVVFSTGSSGANIVAQLSEFSGVSLSSPLDKTGTIDNPSSSTSLSVSTSGNVAAPNELAVTLYATSSGLSSFTPGSGWTSLTSAPGSGYSSDYKMNPTSGAVASEAVTSNPQTSWAAAIATFLPACSGASLAAKASPTLSFPSVTLNGFDATSTLAVVVTLDDETGTGSGWHLTGTSTTLTATGGKTLPNTATTITAASASAASGNCSMPTNSITYPLTLPAATTAPTAASLYNAAVSSGQGPVDVTLTAKVAVPGKARSGAYSSTWTLGISSGP